MYVIFLTDHGWDFTDAATYSGDPRPHEYEIEGLANFMAWANKHYRMSRTKPLDDETIERMARQLEGRRKK